MVLQQNAKNCIFGTALANTTVSLSFRGNVIPCVSHSDGSWKIEFNPGAAGGPFDFVVKSGEDSIVYKDVFVGEVWLLSGQSNAELKMESLKFHYPEEFSAEKNANVRMINVPIKYSFDGEKNEVENPQWLCAAPETVGLMSGTGYFFAKKLSQSLGVPVGIVNASQGGSPISSWMNEETLRKANCTTDYLGLLAKWQNADNVASMQKTTAQNLEDWNKDLNAGVELPAENEPEGWSDCTVPGFIDEPQEAGLILLRRTVKLTAEQVKICNSQKTHLWLGTILDADVTYVNGIKVGETTYRYPPRRYEIPSGTLREGENLIYVLVQRNSKNLRIVFYPEKPYCLFTDNVSVCPVSFRGVEPWKESAIPSDGVYIDLTGRWQMKVIKKMPDYPPELFFEWQPTALYNAMLAPCFNYAISGAFWYQGESDAGRPEEYKKLLPLMIELWRNKFIYAKKDFPFVVIQLPNWGDFYGESYINEALNWPALREAQSYSVRTTANTGLAVTIDAGEWNDLHPEKKQTVGFRSAYEALRLAYGRNDIEYSPRFVSFERSGNALVLKFDCGCSSLLSADKELCGFYVIERQGGRESRVNVKASICGDNAVRVELPSDGCTITELRYLWADSPARVSLYSKNLMLPAEPFRVNLL